LRNGGPSRYGAVFAVFGSGERVYLRISIKGESGVSADLRTTKVRIKTFRTYENVSRVEH